MWQPGPEWTANFKALIQMLSVGSAVTYFAAEEGT
jgi:hypothetical protein